MIISDLSYLESVENDVVGGFNLGYDNSYINFKEKFSIKKYIGSYVHVKGNSATAEADAYGFDTLTQTFSNVTPWSSNSVSISATNQKLISYLNEIVQQATVSPILGLAC